MKTRISLIMILVLACIVLAQPTPVRATTPVDNLVITADLQITGDGYAVGDFNITSPLFTDDCGPAFQNFKIVDGTVHGVKTLQGAYGTIVIKFQAQITPTGAVGRFVIISGDGAYINLHGVGTSSATIDQYGHILARYEGWAHLDP